MVMAVASVLHQYLHDIRKCTTRVNYHGCKTDCYNFPIDFRKDNIATCKQAPLSENDHYDYFEWLSQGQAQCYHKIVGGALIEVWSNVIKVTLGIVKSI